MAMASRRLPPRISSESVPTVMRLEFLPSTVYWALFMFTRTHWAYFGRLLLAFDEDIPSRRCSVGLLRRYFPAPRSESSPSWITIGVLCAFLPFCWRTPAALITWLSLSKSGVIAAQRRILDGLLSWFNEPTMFVE